MKSIHAILAFGFVLGISGCGDLIRESAALDAYRRGVALDVKAQRSAAADAYRESLALHPTSLAANNLAIILAKQGDVQEAAHLFAFAVEVEERDVIARTNLGVVLFHQGHAAQAAEAFHIARNVRDEVLQTAVLYGRVDWDQERYAAATARSDAVAARYLERLAHPVAPAAFPSSTPKGDTELALNLTAGIGAM
jgi:Tfp pilus assembly protein PilF